MLLRLRVNGNDLDLEVSPGSRLIDVLRTSLGLTGAKEGCGRGECGACTVLVNGQPVMSCLAFAETVVGEITTVEGLAEANLDLRQAFADSGAFQCGFCTPGQIVRAAALLRSPLPPDLVDRERFVRHALSGNICRCTGYTGIVDAVLKVAAERQAGA